MNKLLLLLLPFYFLICSNSGAQITITNTSMPASGDTIRYSNVLPTTMLNFDTTGAGMAWDFSGLTPLSQGVAEYKSATAVNLTYGLFFGFTSYGLKVFDSLGFGAYSLYDGYDFYQNNSTQFKSVGRGLEFQGFPIPSFYSDDDEIYQFPLQYADYDSSTFRVTFQLSTFIDLIQSGSRVNDVEGWGTVITPYGSFNCLKVKTTIYETDSLTFNSIPLPPISRVSREYKWLATTEKIPVLQVNGTVTGANFFVNSIRYRDLAEPLAISTHDFKNGISIFPNPASEYVTINCTEPILFTRLTDVFGRIICESKTEKIAVNNFESGMYFIDVVTKKNVHYSLPLMISR